MKAIVCVEKNWGIGRNNDMLFHISEDLKYFKKKTIDNVVVMGMNTLRSLPKGEPLKGRTNIVLSTSIANSEAEEKGLIVARTLDQLLDLVTEQESLGKEVYVIGGGKVYEALIPYCSAAYVTKVEEHAPADTYFPNLDTYESWEMVRDLPAEEDTRLDYHFCKYINRDPKLPF